MKSLLKHAAFWKNLLELQATPHAIAGGFAIGMFVGFTPLFGLKTLLTLGAAAALRCNPVAALVGVSLHDLFTPFLPFSLRMEYDLGYWLLSHPHHLPPKLEIGHLEVHQLLHWTTFLHEGFPLLLGSLVVGIPASILSYFAVKRWLLNRRKTLSSN